MKKTNLFIYTLLTVFVAVGFTSCQKSEKIGGTAVQNASGEFWVKLDNGTGEFGNDWYTFATYNTSSNKSDSIWVDDYANASSGKPFWQIKGKVKIDLSNLTFSGNNVVNQDYDSHFTITDGKILRGAATAPGTKTKTDSISFKIQFDDEDPSVVHTVGGYARTRWDADDHY